VPGKFSSFDASANSVARFENYNIFALTPQRASGGQSGHAGADYDYISAVCLGGRSNGLRDAGQERAGRSETQEL